MYISEVVGSFANYEKGDLASGCVSALSRTTVEPDSLDGNLLLCLMPRCLYLEENVLTAKDLFCLVVGLTTGPEDVEMEAVAGIAIGKSNLVETRGDQMGVDLGAYLDGYGQESGH